MTFTLSRRRAITLAAAAGASMAANLARAQTETETTTATPAPAELKDFSIGAADAKVTVVEYASFTCPHCARFHTEVYPQIKANYIDTGKIRFELREVYFDRFGLWAAIVARCGGEMRYFGIADMIMKQQQKWVGDGSDATVIIDNLRKIGLSAGLDNAALDQCLKDEATAKALVERYETNAKADGIEGTPTFFINGAKHQNMAYEDFAKLLDEALAAN